MPEVLAADVSEALGMLEEHRQRLLRVQEAMYQEVIEGHGEPRQREASHWSALQAEMLLLRRRMGWE